MAAYKKEVHFHKDIDGEIILLAQYLAELTRQGIEFCIYENGFMITVVISSY